MDKEKDGVKVYTLFGSDEKENIDRRIAFLTSLLGIAERKGPYLGQLRQRNMNYALVAFAGLFTFSFKMPTKLYSLFVSAALFIIVLVFCLLDLRFHKFVHGWRESEKAFIKAISEVINDPTKKITFVRYIEEAEREAENFSLQPMIFYLLVVASFIHLLYSLITLIKG
jgi:hypothetical protein